MGHLKDAKQLAERIKVAAETDAEDGEKLAVHAAAHMMLSLAKIANALEVHLGIGKRDDAQEQNSGES